MAILIIPSRPFIGEGRSSKDPTLGPFKDIAARTDEEVKKMPQELVFFFLAAGKNETEAGHARAKAEADIALNLPAEYGD